MDSPEKLATRRAGEKKTNKQIKTKTQYVMDTTKRKQTQIT